MIKYNKLAHAVKSEEIGTNGIYHIYKNDKNKFYISTKELKCDKLELTIYKIDSEIELNKLIRKRKILKLDDNN